MSSVQFADAIQFVLTGELDLSNADRLKDIVLRALENAGRKRGGPARLILDMRRLSFIDSTGIQALLVAKRHCEDNGTRLSLKVGDSQVGRVLALAGVADLLGTE